MRKSVTIYSNLSYLFPLFENSIEDIVTRFKSSLTDLVKTQEGFIKTLNPKLQKISINLDVENDYYNETYPRLNCDISFERDLTPAEVQEAEKTKIAAAKRVEKLKLERKLKKEKEEAEEKALYEKLKAKYDSK